MISYLSKGFAASCGRLGELFLRQLSISLLQELQSISQYWIYVLHQRHGLRVVFCTTALELQQCVL